MLRSIAMIFLLAMPVGAEEVVAGLSQTRVAISTTFSGSEILIFGAVKREAAIPEDPLEVIVTVSGPSAPVVVRKKDRRFGIWINTEAVEVDAAPSFYSVSTSATWPNVLSNVEDLRHKVSVQQAIRSVGAPPGITDAERFTDALIRIREAQRLYETRIASVKFTEATLFETSVALPANLTEGTYIARFLLTRNGRVVDIHEEAINVTKVGLERFLFTLSREQPLIYGLLSLAIAIFAGWGASAIFRYIRG
ncbi:MAG: TIGR02186 family protein [Pseudomonadota bacterium]